MIKTLFVDMDGVFVDYEKHFNDHSEVKLSFYNENKDYENELDALKSVFVSKKEFFLNAPLMDDGIELYNNLLKIQSDYGFYISLLTAVGKHHPELAVEQKMKWAKKHLPDFEFNYVIRSHHKANIAKPYTLLIDDREKSLNPFLNKGGQGILHTSAKNTIENLKNLL